MEDNQNVSRPNIQTEACNADGAGAEIANKVENDVKGIPAADSWNVSSNGLTKGGLSSLADTPATPVVSPAADMPGGVALKMATTVLQPICLGDSPLMLPIQLQMAGAAGAQIGQMGAAPCFLTSQGPVSLPLVLDQQVLQHLSPPVLPQNTSCPAMPLQNNVLCQNTALTLGLPPVADQKSAGHSQDTNLLSLLQNPSFSAILQDLFSSQTGASTFHLPGSAPADSFTSTFFQPPPLSHPYTSPLAPLVPPPTLLVPYPVVIPLPVPLPIPLPIPIPVPQSEDSKCNVPKSVCTVSRSTQTTKDATSPCFSQSTLTSPSHRQSIATSALPSAEVEALDLSMSVNRTCPVEPKQEFPCPQDNVLDLSVAGVKKKCVQSSKSPGGERVFTFQSSQAPPAAALSLGVLRPVQAQGVDSKLLGSLASLEFSRRHKWLVDGSPGASGSLGSEASLNAAGNLEIVSASQTAKVIVSVKDAIPAILCGKIKGLSGVSTKNFSIKGDGSQGAALQQLYAAQSRTPGEQPDPNQPPKKIHKNRAIKLKKVSSQEIHFLPIKKQRLTAFLPRK